MRCIPIALALLIVLLAGCTTGYHLDRVAASLDRWGTVSISGASLIQPDPNFRLDLDLSADEIFRRNRIEGFSTISQFDDLDVQVSVQAEVIANLVDEMQATGDPKLFKGLRTKLMAAAFKALLGNLSEDQRAALAPLLEPLEQPIESDDEGDPGEAEASDGGEGALDDARKKRDEAKKHLNDARDAKKEFDDAGEEAAKKEHKADLQEALNKALTACHSVADLSSKSAEQAYQLASDAQRAFRKESPEFREEAENITAQIEKAFTEVGEAETQADKVKSAADAAKSTVEEQLEDDTDLDDAKLGEAIAAVDALLKNDAEDDKSVNKLIDETSQAVMAARMAASRTGAPIGPTKRPPKIITAPKIPLEERLAFGKLPALRDALLNPVIEPELNLRQLLLLTASDKMTLEMLRWLTYPRDDAPNKQIYLCVASVSVVPGKWTGSGYIGEVDLYMRLAKQADNGQIYTSYPPVEPTVFSVFPFIDSQVLDLRTSRRRIFTMALQLIVNGYPQAGRLMLDYARQRQQDMRTITGLNTVTSYGNGRHVGFRFAPRLVAQDDPTDVNTGPAFNLQPQHFPVIIMAVVDEKPFVPKPAAHVWYTTEGLPISTCAWPECPRKLTCESNEHRIPKFDKNARSDATHMVWYQRHRWMRAPDRGWSRYIPFWRTITDIFKGRLTEYEMIDRARHLDKVRREYKEIQDGWRCNPQLRESRQFYYRAIWNRTNYLAAHGVGSVTTFALPRFVEGDKEIGAIAIKPDVLWIDKPNQFTIVAQTEAPVECGKGPFAKGFSVSVGGMPVNATRLSGKALKVVMPPWKDIVDPKELEHEEGMQQFKAQVAVTNGQNVVEEEVTFRYFKTKAKPQTLSARFPGGRQSITPSSPNNSDRTVIVELSRPVAGVTKATILIPNPGADGTLKVLTLDASVNASGLVQADDTIDAADNPDDWKPSKEFHQLDGHTVSGVKVMLEMPSGNELTIPVSGLLVFKK